jgi:adenylate kinase
LEVFVIFLLFGPPGCGKGTQAAYLAGRFHIPAISTGEMFRAECKAGTELGKAACEILAKGALVGDDLVNGIVANRIARPDCANGFLLDGYPRTVPQAIYFSAVLRERDLPVPVVIHLDVPDEALVSRLTARRQCPDCGHIYNALLQPPQITGLCDRDGAALITREDDREEVIRRRLRAYDELTGPILKWYGPSVVRTVDGTRSADDVARAVARVAMEATSLVGVG